ncbi:MAG TPA: choice-of-anchor Q domain-containing protein [Chitinispirillaceae bacterium]|nr:choice-of-anchor Q domain-containing protein [Chitinispirillaceae bacterium]
MDRTDTSRNVVLITSILCSTLFFHSSAASVTVGNFSELLNAISSVSEGDTILLRDGTYTVNNGYGAQVRKNNIVIKSLSGNRDKVIVSGGGMSGGTNYGFWIPAHNVTIQGITIKDVTTHCIQTDVNSHKLRVINCVLKDAYEQLLKVPAGNGTSDSGLVEGCLFEFSKGVAENYYTGGIDCHRSKDWIVRNNTFRNIRSPGGSIAEHAIHFWNNCENITVENNVIIDCDRGIGMGLGNENIQNGGLIRNNMIFHRSISGTDFGDVGIALENCIDFGVYGNTIYFDNNYSNAIEYRFSGTQRVTIQNNLTNKRIQMRDGASGTVNNNSTNAQKEWFVAPSSGDLHLTSGSINSVIDKGITVSGFTSDFDGDKRPMGSGVDIGADEYSGSSTIITRQKSTTVSPAPGYQKVLFYNHSADLMNKTAVSGYARQQLISLTGAILLPSKRLPLFHINNY